MALSIVKVEACFEKSMDVGNLLIYTNGTETVDKYLMAYNFFIFMKYISWYKFN